MLLQQYQLLSNEMNVLRQNQQLQQLNTISVPSTKEWPKFSGRVIEEVKQGHKFRSEDVNVFLFDIEQTFIAFNIKEDLVKLAHTSNCLRGGAKIWFRSIAEIVYNSHSTNISQWDNFKELIRTQYAVIHQQSQLRTDLENLKQFNSETVSSYADKFRNMILQVQDMSEFDKIHSFIRGLLPRTQAQVRYLDPKSLHDAMRIAVSFDQAMATSYNNFKKPPQKFDHKNFDFKPKDSSVTDMELDFISKKKKVDWGKYKKEGRCIRCHEIGHIGINCQKFPGPVPKKENLKEQAQ